MAKGIKQYLLNTYMILGYELYGKCLIECAYIYVALYTLLTINILMVVNRQPLKLVTKIHVAVKNHF